MCRGISSKTAITKIQAIIMIIVIVVAGSITYYYFTLTQVKPSEKEYITFGVTLPLTGSMAFEGEHRSRTIDIITQYLNEKGGLFVKEYGRKLNVTYILYDDTSDPARVRDNIERLVTIDKVDFLFCDQSGNKEAVMMMAQKYKIPQLSSGWLPAMLDQKGDVWFFSIIPPYSEYPRSSLEFIKWVIDNPNIPANLKPQRIAMVYGSGSFGVASHAGALYWAKTYGIDHLIVAQEQYLDGAKDFTPVITKVMAANPDVFFANGRSSDTQYLIYQAKEMGLNCKLWVNVLGSDTDEFRNVLGDKGLGIVGLRSNWPAQPWAGEWCGFKWSSAEIFDRYYKRGINYTSGYDISTLGCFQVLTEAIYRAGTLNFTAVRNKILELGKEGFMIMYIGTWLCNQTTGERMGARFAACQLQMVGGALKPVIVYPEEQFGFKIQEAKPIYPDPTYKP